MVTRALAIILLAAFVVSLCPAHAQAMPDSWIRLGEDPEGDVDVRGLETDTLPHMDLTILEAAEGDQRLWFRLGVAGFGESTDAPVVGSTSYFVEFSIGEQRYKIAIQRTQPVPVFSSGSNYQASLEAYDRGLGSFAKQDAAVGLIVDEPGGQLTANLSWEDVPSEQGLRALPGDAVGGIQAYTLHSLDEQNQLTGMGGGMGLNDRLPDSGALEYRVQALGYAGHEILITSQNPLRASNGAAATFLFPLELSNLLPIDALVELDVQDLPDGWTASPLANPVPVGASSVVTTSVVVSTSSSHQHGGLDAFNVTAWLDGESKGSVAFEVHYTDIAQPSGHHPGLQFYTVNQGIADPYEELSGFYANEIFMTTAANPDEDDGVPVTQTTIGDRQGWRIRLNPSLGLGLDFTQQPGLVEVRLEPSQPWPIESLTLEAVLFLQRPDEGLLLMGGSSEVGTLADARDVAIPLSVMRGVDVVPYERDQNLVLHLYADYPDVTRGSVVLNMLPGGSATLPLEEYQDVIPAGLLSPIRASMMERTLHVNPGERVNFELNIQGPEGLEVAVDALGVAAPWEAVLRPSAVTLPAGPIFVQVIAPPDATAGDEASFFVRALPSEGAPTAAGLRAVVVTDQDLPDAASLDVPGKQSNAAGVIALGTIVLAIQAIQRRRSDLAKE